MGVGYGREIYGGVRGMGKGEGVGNGNGEEGGVGGIRGSRTPDTGSSDEEWEVEGGKGGAGGSGGVNGEAVREGMEKWRGKMVGRAVVWGVGWVVTVVGLWGDGV